MRSNLSRERAAQAAEEQGLLFLGVAPLDVGSAFERFSRWLAEGRHGSMRWLEQHGDVRRSPERLLAGAKAALVFGLPYAEGVDEAPGPRVAKYARFRDYHRVLGDAGTAIATTLARSLGGEFRVAVDTLPLLEKAVAAGTARGFFGKHSCFVHPKNGSFLLLLTVLTTLPLDPDVRPAWDGVKRTEHGGCGSCTLCQVRCPTGALDDAYRIDARRCLSYWTIEHRGAIPAEFWPYLAEYWYGCDICQDVCPYNRGSVAGPAARTSRPLPALEAVATMTQLEYENWFGGSAMTRAKRAGLRRNALIALAVTNRATFADALARCREDESLTDVVAALDAAANDGTLARCRSLVSKRRQERLPEKVP